MAGKIRLGRSHDVDGEVERMRVRTGSRRIEGGAEDRGGDVVVVERRAAKLAGLTLTCLSAWRSSGWWGH